MASEESLKLQGLWDFPNNRPLRPDRHDRGWPKGPITDTAPGPVRFPTRDELLDDGRRAHWHPIQIGSPVPANRVIWLAWPAKGGTPPAWNMFRAKWDGERRAFCDPENRMALPGSQDWTHWAEDILGTPVGLANETASR